MVYLQSYGAFTALAKCQKSWANFLRVYLTFGIVLNLLWPNGYGKKQIFIVENGQMLKNNRAIWSHCAAFTIEEATLVIASMECSTFESLHLLLWAEANVRKLCSKHGAGLIRQKFLRKFTLPSFLAVLIGWKLLNSQSECFKLSIASS